MGLSGKGSPNMTRKELKELQMSDVSKPDELVTRIQGVGRWTLEVVESRMITPRMHRIRLRGSEFRGFDYRPGQDVMLRIPADGDAIILSSSILSLVIPKHAFEVLYDYYRPI
jgi:NAD(P)H-flavin reductase